MYGGSIPSVASKSFSKLVSVCARASLTHWKGLLSRTVPVDCLPLGSRSTPGQLPPRPGDLLLAALEVAYSVLSRHDQVRGEADEQPVSGDPGARFKLTGQFRWVVDRAESTVEDDVALIGAE